MRERTSAALCNRFAAAVAAQDSCIWQGDSRAGNRHARIYIAAARELLKRGEEAIEEFTGLLEHSSDSVRVAAAAYLLRHRTDRAVSTLRPIARKKRGIAALGARETLKRYERGELDIR